jgi:hypothetical protein
MPAMQAIYPERPDNRLAPPFPWGGWPMAFLPGLDLHEMIIPP